MHEIYSETRRDGSRPKDGLGEYIYPTVAIAHDFRNLMQLAASAIRITRQRLQGRVELELIQTLSDGLDALERASRLSNRLGTSALPRALPQPVLLQSVLPRLRDLMKHAVGDKIRLETFVSKNLPPLLCNRDDLENALFNLVVNARDAMPHGGSLLIDAKRCRAPGHDGNCIVVSVADTGTGMPQDVAAKAFQALFTTKRSSGGSGLGLFNVRMFAEALGGSTELASAREAGTRVKLHLPSGST